MGDEAYVTAGLRVLGATLQQVLSWEIGLDLHVPFWIKIACKALLFKDTFNDKLWLSAGIVADIPKLLENIESGAETLNVRPFSALAIGRLLVLYMKKLPTPLLTFELHDQLMASAQLELFENNQQRLQFLSDILRTLPSPNFLVLRKLLRMLAKVWNDRSKETQRNTIEIWAPILMLRENVHDMPADLPWACLLLRILIENHEVIFPKKSQRAAPNHGNVHSTTLTVNNSPEPDMLSPVAGLNMASMGSMFSTSLSDDLGPKKLSSSTSPIQYKDNRQLFAHGSSSPAIVSGHAGYGLSAAVGITVSQSAPFGLPTSHTQFPQQFPILVANPSNVQFVRLSTDWLGNINSSKLHIMENYLKQLTHLVDDMKDWCLETQVTCEDLEMMHAVELSQLKLSTIIQTIKLLNPMALIQLIDSYHLERCHSYVIDLHSTLIKSRKDKTFVRFFESRSLNGTLQRLYLSLQQDMALFFTSIDNLLHGSIRGDPRFWRQVSKHTVDLIFDLQAKQLWVSKFGLSAFAVPWDYFVRHLFNSSSTTLLSQLHNNNMTKATIEMHLRHVLDDAHVGLVSVFKFARFLDAFGDLSSSVSNCINVVTKPWFHGYVSRNEASRLLESYNPCAFIIRFAYLDPSSFAINFKDENHQLYSIDVNIILRDSAIIQMQTPSLPGQPLLPIPTPSEQISTINSVDFAKEMNSNEGRTLLSKKSIRKQASFKLPPSAAPGLTQDFTSNSKSSVLPPQNQTTNLNCNDTSLKITTDNPSQPVGKSPSSGKVHNRKAANVLGDDENPVPARSRSGSVATESEGSQEGSRKLRSKGQVSLVYQVKEEDEIKEFLSLEDIIWHYNEFLKTTVEYKMMMAPWFYGEFTAQESQQYLQHEPVGTFLVRFSSHRAKLTLDYVSEDGTVIQHRLDRTNDSKIANGSLLYEDIDHFVSDTKGLKFPYKHDNQVSTTQEEDDARRTNSSFISQLEDQENLPSDVLLGGYIHSSFRYFNGLDSNSGYYHAGHSSSPTGSPSHSPRMPSLIAVSRPRTDSTWDTCQPPTPATIYNFPVPHGKSRISRQSSRILSLVSLKMAQNAIIGQPLGDKIATKWNGPIGAVFDPSNTTDGMSSPKIPKTEESLTQLLTKVATRANLTFEEVDRLLILSFQCQGQQTLGSIQQKIHSKLNGTTMLKRRGVHVKPQTICLRNINVHQLVQYAFKIKSHNKVEVKYFIELPPAISSNGFIGISPTSGQLKAGAEELITVSITLFRPNSIHELIYIHFDDLNDDAPANSPLRESFVLPLIVCSSPKCMENEFDSTDVITTNSSSSSVSGSQNGSSISILTPGFVGKPTLQQGSILHHTFWSIPIYFKDQLKVGQPGTKKLGSGASATVFLAKLYGVDVAAKVWELGAKDLPPPDFEQELAIMASTRHPNLVKFIGAISARGTACIVMEFVSGGSLDKFLKFKPADQTSMPPSTTVYHNGLEVKSPGPEFTKSPSSSASNPTNGSTPSTPQPDVSPLQHRAVIADPLSGDEHQAIVSIGSLNLHNNANVTLTDVELGIESSYEVIPDDILSSDRSNGISRKDTMESAIMSTLSNSLPQVDSPGPRSGSRSLRSAANSATTPTTSPLSLSLPSHGSFSSSSSSSSDPAAGLIGPNNFTARIPIALEVAKALLYLHERNLIHRDVKSLNVLIDSETLSVRLSDFGEATSKDASLSEAVGSTPWMAPEVCLSQAYSTKADVFSFGLVLYELLVETYPVRTFMMIAEGKIPHIPGPLCLEYPAYVRLIHACTLQNPDKRPTMFSVVRELEKIASKSHRRVRVANRT